VGATSAHEGYVDTCGKGRRSWSTEVKRKIAEESFEGTSSVAQLGQKYAVNANQIFQWRKQYREGRLESKRHLATVLTKSIFVMQRDESLQGDSTAAGLRCG
jgi:transposase-like protein